MRLRPVIGQNDGMAPAEQGTSIGRLFDESLEPGIHYIMHAASASPVSPPSLHKPWTRVLQVVSSTKAGQKEVAPCNTSPPEVTGTPSTCFSVTLQMANLVQSLEMFGPFSPLWKYKNAPSATRRRSFFLSSLQPAAIIMYQIGNIYFITAIAVIGGGLFGFDISSMSAIIGTDQYKCYFNQGPEGPPQCSGPRSDVQGGITASMPGGSFIGALASGFLSDIFGRKRAIQIGAVIWCIGSIIVCASQNIGMLIVGRFINGFSVGICSAQVPVYVSELAPPSKRGRVVGAQQWAITWGILIMFYISYGCSFVSGPAAFRIPWGLQMIPAIILFFALFLLPESPRWLARKDRWEDCHNVLALVHAKGNREAPFVLLELNEIREMCEFERRNADVSYLELFKPRMINRTHIGVFTQIWSQLTGMNVMMYYITYVFGMAGLSGNANLVASSIQYVINVFMTIFALMFIDRWGRRWPLIVGSTFMAIWMYANAGLMASYGKPAPPGGVDHVSEESWQIHGGAAKGVIACTYLFVASFAPTWGPVSWIYPPELYPLRVRGKAVALTTSANWIFNFALSYFVPPAFVNIQWKVYIIFGVFCTAMTIHVFFLFPETAGKTLEEVEEIFLSDVKPWNTHVNYQNIKREERGEVDTEKRLSYAVHRERGGSDHAEVGQQTQEIAKNEAA